jgi:hypothetical protein
MKNDDFNKVFTIAILKEIDAQLEKLTDSNEIIQLKKLREKLLNGTN